MKSLELLALGIRLVGIYGLFKLLSFIGGSYSALYPISQGSLGVPSEWYVYIGIVIFLYALLVTTFVCKPVFVAKKLLPKVAGNEPEFGGKVSDLQVAVLTVIGVYVLAWAIPDLVYNVVRAWSAHTMLDGIYRQYTLHDFLASAAVSFLRVVIGLCLCLQATGLIKIIHRMRNYGLSKTAEQEG